MDIHRFDKNGFYIGSHKARLDPEETKVQGENIFLKPPNSFFGELLQVSKNEILKLVNNELVIVPNYKGQYYYKQDGVKIIINEYGIDIPIGCLQIDPRNKYEDSHNGVSWSENIEKKEADEADEAYQAAKGIELASNPLANITFKQAETWINNNVTDLSSAKEAMKKIVKLIIART